jgi:hypothetical protein
VIAEAECLISAWNERQVRRMPLLFAPIGAALAAICRAARAGPMHRSPNLCACLKRAFADEMRIEHSNGSLAIRLAPLTGKFRLILDARFVDRTAAIFLMAWPIRIFSGLWADTPSAIYH